MLNVWLLGLLILRLVWAPPVFSEIVDKDIKQCPECKYCGMKRQVFAHSRMMVLHGDMEAVGVCSINCAAVDHIKDVDDPPSSMKVGDYKTKKLIDAETAYWVLGGDEQGVMTNRAKWAFEKEADARAFIKAHGGELISFERAMTASYEDISEDMMRLKRMKLEYSRAKHGVKSRHD